jgi:hypothetical protein
MLFCLLKVAVYFNLILDCMYLIQRLILLPLLALISCGTPNYPPVENPLDAGRQFAEAIFKGNFERASQLIVPDEQNKNLLRQRLEEVYHQRNSTDRNQMSQESLKIQHVENLVKDSVMIIHFINAYDGKPAVLKVVKNNDSWLVDLKYTFAGK